MSSLQLGLIVAGVVLVVGVIIYNWLTERRVRRRINEAFPTGAGTAETTRELPPGASSARVEPTLPTARETSAARENVPRASVEPDVEGYEPQVLDGLAGLMAHAVPLTFEFTPSRYSAETKQRLVQLLVRHYSTVHSLGRRDAAAPIGTLASREHTDDVLVH